MDYSELQMMINQSNNIVFFGGAGVSTESNIPDFRSSEGIFYKNEGLNYPPEVILSHQFFMEHPDLFFQFYKDKMVHSEALPNTAHLALAKLEQLGKLKAIITQNIDGLHQTAGSDHVIELHGSVYRNYCMDCHAQYGLTKILNEQDIIPTCNSCGGIIKPDVVLYQEPLDQVVLERAVDAIANAEVLIVAGTSLTVYPAASLIDYYQGNKLVLINTSKTSYDQRANYCIHEQIGLVFASLVDIN